MEVKLEREYTFLRKKYNEILLPTFLMVMSEKICTVIDIIIIGFFLSSTQLAIVNLAVPITYITGIFYIFFGQGGNLLALRAQSQLNSEKTNFYFTISILGICIVSIILLLFIFLFVDNILMMFNVPAEIFNISKEYILIFMFFYPLNCYLLVISFFIRSDGMAKMPFYAVTMANVLNIFFDLLFLKVFNMGVTGTALASVLGYLVGAIYISTYLFNKNSSYKLVLMPKFNIKEIVHSLKEILLNTPEVIGKVCFGIKVFLLTYLCSVHYGVAGLLAFLVYDNSETFIYMFLSGIMKTMSPIVTVLYKEMDFDAVDKIIRRSFKHVFYVSFPVSVLFFVYPQIVLSLFNIVDPYYVNIVSLAIRITAFSLVGRSISYLYSNYAQAIGQNRISSIILFLEEFLFAIGGAIIITNIMGGIGIWISILLAETIPVLIYIIYSSKLQKTHKIEIKKILMLQNSNLITMTYSRSGNEKTDKDVREQNKEIILYIENVFKENAIFIRNSITDICRDIFENDENLQDIDITIRLIDEELYVIITSDGKLYNPYSNENLMKSKAILELSKLNCKFEYEEILGFNKEYIILQK